MAQQEGGEAVPGAQDVGLQVLPQPHQITHSFLFDGGHANGRELSSPGAPCTFGRRIIALDDVLGDLQLGGVNTSGMLGLYLRSGREFGLTRVAVSVVCEGGGLTGGSAGVCEATRERVA